MRRTRTGPALTASFDSKHQPTIAVNHLRGCTRSRREFGRQLRPGSDPALAADSAPPRRCARHRRRHPTDLDRELLAGGLGYPSTAEANEATPPQIAAHSPSDDSKTTISEAARADRSDRDGPEVISRLRGRTWRSAASTSRCDFWGMGFAGVGSTRRRCTNFISFMAIVRTHVILASTTGTRLYRSPRPLWQKWDPPMPARRSARKSGSKMPRQPQGADTMFFEIEADA